MMLELGLGAAAVLLVLMVGPIVAKVAEAGASWANLMAGLAILAVDRPAIVVGSVSYTNLSLPTVSSVWISWVASSVTKKDQLH